MSIAWGATSLGVTAPAGYLQESSSDQTIEIATIRDADGPVVVAQAKPRNTTTTTVKTKGEVSQTAVPMGNFSGATCTSSKVSQTNDDFSTSEATYTLYA